MTDSGKFSLLTRNGKLARAQRGLAASVLALLTAAPALTAESSPPAALAFAPTMADYQGVYDALQRYRFGVEKHDQKTQDSAFWTAPEPPRPPPGFVPPPGFKPGTPGGGGMDEVWHLPLDSYIHFDSATRATHYEYFLSIYPQPEKKADAANPGNMQTRTSIVGWPGHYEDTLEKRHGEWRLLQRKTRINEK